MGLKTLFPIIIHNTNLELKKFIQKLSLQYWKQWIVGAS